MLLKPSSCCCLSIGKAVYNFLLERNTTKKILMSTCEIMKTSTRGIIDDVFN